LYSSLISNYIDALNFSHWREEEKGKGRRRDRGAVVMERGK
jgi:hypothetical protein